MFSKSLKLIAVSMLVIVSVLGCSKSDADKAKDAAADMKAVAGEAGEKAADAVASSFDELKGAYLTTVKATLGELGTKVEGLVAKTEALPEATKKPVEEAMASLKASHEEATMKLAELEDSGEADFEAKRTEMDAALSDLKGSFEKVASLFK